MSYVIPSDTQQIGDLGHTPAHDNIADTLGILARIASAGSGGSVSAGLADPAGNAANMAALAAMASWASPPGGLMPWQFHVAAYGALGNGKIVSDITMPASSNQITSNTGQAQFTSADIGKHIVVSVAGGSTGGSPPYYNIPLAGTITGVSSATVATVSFSSVSAAPPSGYYIAAWATDDTAAIQAAINAAVAYAQSGAHQGTYAEVIFDPLVYGIAGNLVTAGTTYGNAQLTLPFISPEAEKVILVLTGRTKAMDQALVHWSQLTPESSGSVLMSLNLTGTNYSYGAISAPASMIGGPYYQAGASNPGPVFGGDLGLFSNMMPVIDGIQLLIPYNAPMGGFDFYGCAEATVVNASVMSMAVVNIQGNASSFYFGTPAVYPNMYGAGNVMQAYGYNQLTYNWTSGLVMPTTGNNDRCDVLYYSCEGMYYGFSPSEHASADTIRAIYCYYGIGAYSGGGVAMPHAARIKYVSCEGSSAAVAPGPGSGTVNLDIDTLDCESSGIIADPTNLINGTFGCRNLGSPGQFGYMGSSLTPSGGGTGVKLVSLDNAAITGIQTAGAAGQAPVPTVGTAQQNRYYRDAIVYARCTNAITGIAVDGVTVTGLTAAANTPVAVAVPAGHTFTITTSGNSGTAAAQWVLF